MTRTSIFRFPARPSAHQVDLAFRVTFWLVVSLLYTFIAGYTLVCLHDRPGAWALSVWAGLAAAVSWYAGYQWAVRSPWPSHPV